MGPRRPAPAQSGLRAPALDRFPPVAPLRLRRLDDASRPALLPFMPALQANTGPLRASFFLESVCNRTIGRKLGPGGSDGPGAGAGEDVYGARERVVVAAAAGGEAPSQERA